MSPKVCYCINKDSLCLCDSKPHSKDYLACTCLLQVLWNASMNKNNIYSNYNVENTEPSRTHARTQKCTFVLTNPISYIDSVCCRLLLEKDPVKRPDIVQVLDLPFVRHHMSYAPQSAQKCMKRVDEILAARAAHPTSADFGDYSLSSMSGERGGEWSGFFDPRPAYSPADTVRCGYAWRAPVATLSVPRIVGATVLVCAFYCVVGCRNYLTKIDGPWG